jgi:RNA exonuclease 4
MGKAFFTKKQKAHMKERRRKKKLTLNTDNIIDKQVPLDGHETVGVGSGETFKKRSREEPSDTAPHPRKLRTRIIDGRLQVAQPADLKSQEAKKFRKDSRRQLRQQQGTSNMEIEFVDAEEMPIRKAKEFPSIKELLQQKRQIDRTEKEEDKRQEKLHKVPDQVKAQYLALDCEMVGIGSDGKKSALARVSIVDWKLNVLMDTFVQVPIRVTDFRTHVSGVEPKHIRPESAMDVAQCRDKVAALLKDKTLVGHALTNDLKALMLTHPKAMIRDTARFRPFQRYGNNKWRARKLRDLVKENLQGKYDGFQEGEHDSVHDARATMELFQLVRNQWEKELGGNTK